MKFIESFYGALNTAGYGMDRSRQLELVEEAKRAFLYNADIYKEQPYFYIGALKGANNLVLGFVKDRFGKNQ